MEEYNRALDIRQQFLTRRGYYFGGQDVLVREAKAVLQEKGILPDEAKLN